MGNNKRQLLIGLLMVFLLVLSGSPAWAENISSKVGLLSIDIESPAGIALDGRETLFLALSTNGSVAVIENDGTRIADIVGFEHPVSVAVNADAGLLYVGDAVSGSVSVYGAALQPLGRLGAGNGEFARPVGIAVDAKGNVFVVDGDRDKVRVYGANKEFGFEFGQSGSKAGQIRHPVSIAVDRGSNEIIVVDRPIITGSTGNFEGSRVQFFDATGKYLRGFGQYGNGEGKLTKATGVAPDHAGRIYVADAELNIVSVFDRAGNYLETVYDATATMATPVGVAVGGISGRLFVSSISGNRVNLYGVNVQHVVDVESSAGGTITPSGRISVLQGSGVSFTAQPDLGYHIEAVLVDGVDIGANEEFSLPVVMADQAVFVQFSKDFHTVQVKGAVGGTITPDGAISVKHKTDLTIIFTANKGWQVADVLVDGISMGPMQSYTLSSVTDDHTVQVTFARISYTITAEAGIGGSISPSGAVTVFEGTDALFLITPATGFRIAGLYIDNALIPAVDAYTFAQVKASHDIRVVFEREILEIVASSSAGGSITPAGVVTVLYGDDRIFNMLADQGYHINEVYVDNRPIGATPRYEFTAIVAPHSIRAEFARNSYFITASSQGSGSVNPSGKIVALYGDSKTFTIIPASGYHTETILVDGQEVEPGKNLTFTEINANHTLTIVFAESNELPVALAGPDQKVVSGTVVLNGEHSFDPDGSIVSYLWEQLDGIPVTLLDPASARASFVVPEVDDGSNSLLFRLTVVDNKGATSESECLITLAEYNLPPAALAGADQTVAPGETVVLNGSDSLDVDGTVVSMTWRQISGKSVTLTDLGHGMASFVAPTREGALAFRLMVTDDTGLRAKDDCLVNITTANEPPVAEAGAELLVHEGETVLLDGSASYDVDDAIRSYLWKQISGTPAVSLENYTTAKAMFTAPRLETTDSMILTFELQVTDQAGLARADQITVFVHKALKESDKAAAYSPKSKNKWINVSIELPVGLGCDAINSNTIAVTRVNGLAVAPLKRTGTIEIVDSNRNGIPELMVKFNREQLVGLLGPGTSIFTVSGSLMGGSEFQQEFKMVLTD